MPDGTQGKDKAGRKKAFICSSGVAVLRQRRMLAKSMRPLAHKTIL